MHILPSRRPAGLQRFFDEGKPEQPGVVVVDPDIALKYSSIKFPSNWTMVVTLGRYGATVASNTGFAAFPDEPWYSMVDDDCVGRTPHWDTILADRASQGEIVWPDDGYGRYLCTMPFIPGKFCRTLGWICYPGFRHFGTDTLWGAIQRKLCPGGCVREVLLEHMHFSNNKSDMDDVYKNRGPAPKMPDKELFDSIDYLSIVEQLCSQ